MTENPATGQPLAEIALGDERDVDRAVAAARRAVDSGVWSGMSPGDRKRILVRFADLIDEHNDELAVTETLDAGKPIADVRTLDIPDTAACIRWHAEATDSSTTRSRRRVPARWRFTGSTEVGRTFLHHAADTNLKRVLLELGGKSPQVIMADAGDLDRIVPQVLNAVFWNMGENCSAGSRLVVHRSRKSELVERLVAAAARDWIVGDPLDESTRIGPMITKGHLERVLGYIAAGRAEGARLVTGGNRVLEESGGHFVAPTIFDDATNNMRIAREEIFGPVLTVIPFDTEAEAIAIANDTPYGLAASVYTENVRVAHRMARAIKAGTVGVNAYSEGDLTTPFGGFKQSGFGGHDKSVHAHAQYTELKTIWIDMADAG